MHMTRWTTLALAIGLWLAVRPCRGQEMTVHFIDVGQGEATLLEFPCGAILIDAGAQSAWYSGRLMTYLRSFFERRDDLEGTLDSVIITHPHIDHNRALKRIFEEFQVNRYIDNGWTQGQGAANARWVRTQIEDGNVATKLIVITDDMIAALDPRTGLTSADIDPISCDDCDPEIHILASRQLDDPGWAPGEFGNPNNHSVVVRVDFGESSFLFTGDLQEPAIETMVDWYSEGSMLDVDVYQVGHHASHNGTTTSLMTAMTPEFAVISCGKPGSRGQRTAYAYGHPRESTITLLEQHVSGTRTAEVVKIATGTKRFKKHTVSKAIYATPWDRTVRIRGRLDADPVWLPPSP